jgi:signal transduction histidine kinase
LKNKYIQIGLLVLTLFLFSLSLLSGIDFWYNRDKITFSSYFKTRDFESQVSREFENIERLYTTYENYDKKTNEEKLSSNESIDNEIENMKRNYDADLRNELQQLKDSYASDIAHTEDTNEIKRLTEERDKKLEEIKNTKTKTLEDVKKEILTRYNKDYENVKKAVQKNSNLKYFMWDSNEIVFTNLADSTDIKDYVNNKALYSIYFPSTISDNRSFLNGINSFFQSKNYKGYILIPNEAQGYSYFQGNSKYFNSVRLRVVIEFFIIILAFGGGLWLLKYLKKNSSESLVYVDKFKSLCTKLPIDVKAIILLFYSLFMLEIGNNGGSIIKQGITANIMPYLFTALYILFVAACIPEIKLVLKDRIKFKEYWHNSLTIKFSRILANGIKNKGIFFRIIITTLLIILFGTIITILALAVTNDEAAAVFLLFIYCLLVFTYLILKARHLDKIIKATDEIASGNLNYTLKDKGHSLLSRMARNINNLQEGVKKSVESQLKSDRLKSELITNVSHDLKTPLTSIINYVDLLKRENLSPEEMRDYIGVLDRKTQRLKTLIEDLFEASKMASGSVELNLEKVDVAQLLNQALAELEEKIQASNLIFKVNIPHSKVYANLDGKKTWRVFENLIGNILKYSQPNTRVYINLYETETKLTITMKNISAYELDFDVEEIYERFKRGDASRHTEGSGLGLAIAKSIVDLQGGTLNIEIDGDLFKVTVEFNK